ncbi:MAG: tetratricopeptide repeat protein [Acidobacteria bacterium]|nr:tetratricopeptide repeat protein [Acidobacteriota bacterium]
MWLLFQVAAAMPLLQEGRFEDARAPLVLACKQGEANGCYLLGRTLYTLEKYDAALATLLPLRATDKDPWRVDDAIALVYEGLRRPAEADKYFQTAITGRAPDPRYHYGRFLIREGHAEKAVAVLAASAKEFPKHELTRFELGRAYSQLGRLQEAEIQLALAPSLDEARRLLIKVRARK